MGTNQPAVLSQALGKRVLVIVGMHRSGTSAATGALQCLGVDLGDKLYSGHKNVNAKGYFEHSDIADTNDDVLCRLGSAWDDILLRDDDWAMREDLRPFAQKIRKYIQRDFSKSALWAVKDPRVCRLLPWWMNLFAEEGITPHFLFVVRSPDDVYRSLERRDGFSRDKSFLLWLLHYLEAERGSRGYPRAFTQFDRFLEDPQGELSRIEQQLMLRYPVSVDAASGCLNQFLSKDLRHHTGSDVRPLGTPITDLAYALEARLQQAAEIPTGQQVQIETDDLWRQMESIQQGFPPMLVEQLHSMAVKRGQLDLTMRRVERSWSWYTGKPVRFIERLFGRDV